MVTLERVKAGSVAVDSMTGSITARDVTAENAVLKTMNGGIEYGGTVSRTGRYEMRDAQRADPPDAQRQRLRPARRRRSAGRSNRTADIEFAQRECDGAVACGEPQGPGGATIVVTTFNGTITIAGSRGSENPDRRAYAGVVVRCTR